MIGSFETWIDDDLVTVEYEAEYEKGKTSGPPEDCYPDSGQCDILSVKYQDGTVIEPSESLLDRLEQLCWDDFWESKVDQSDGPEPDDDFTVEY